MKVNMAIRTHKQSSVLLILLSLLSIGCGPSKQSSVRPEDVLITVPNAREIDRREFQEKHQLIYRLDIPHPATSVTEELADHLERAGWEFLNENWLNPGMIRSKPFIWGSYEDHSKDPHTIVFSASGQWQNEDGDIVEYILQYREVGETPPEKPTTDELLVIGILTPADVARKLKKVVVPIPAGQDLT